MSERKVSSAGWSFWFQWVGANTVGGVILGLALLTTNSGVFVNDAVTIAVAAGSWLVAAALIGILQWRILRQQISVGVAWPRVSGIGWGIGILVSSVIMFFPALGAVGGAPLASPPFGVIIGFALTGGALVGFVIGILQMFILEKWISKASWWVSASVVGWAIVGWGLALDSWDLWDVSLWYLGLVIGQALYGAITGFALVWLLRQPRPEA